MWEQLYAQPVAAADHTDKAALKLAVPHQDREGTLAALLVVAHRAAGLLLGDRQALSMGKQLSLGVAVASQAAAARAAHWNQGGCRAAFRGQRDLRDGVLGQVGRRSAAKAGDGQQGEEHGFDYRLRAGSAIAGEEGAQWQTQAPLNYLISA